MAVFEAAPTAVLTTVGLLAKTELCETCAGGCGTESFIGTGLFDACDVTSGVDLFTDPGLGTADAWAFGVSGAEPAGGGSRVLSSIFTNPHLRTTAFPSTAGL